MIKYEYIPINIWDGFKDDDVKLETDIFVADSFMPHEKRKDYLEVILDYINRNLNTEGIKLWMEYFISNRMCPSLVNEPETQKLLFDRWEIKVEGLTHKRLDEWIIILDSAEISADSIPFYIYSES